MPKLIGHSPGELGAEIVAGADIPESYITLDWKQAALLRRLLPSATILAVLNATDRGSRGVLAKRWYNWFGDAAEICTVAKRGTAMRERCESHLRGESHRTLAKNAHDKAFLENEDIARKRERECTQALTDAHGPFLAQFGEATPARLVVAFPGQTCGSWRAVSEDLLRSLVDRLRGGF